MVRFYFFFAKTFHRHDAVFIQERIYTVADLISEEGNAANEPGARIMLGIIFPSTTYPLLIYSLILKGGANSSAYGHRRHRILPCNHSVIDNDV